MIPLRCSISEHLVFGCDEFARGRRSRYPVRAAGPVRKGATAAEAIEEHVVKRPALDSGEGVCLELIIF